MEYTTGGRLEVRVSPEDVGKRVSVRTRTGPEEPKAAFTDTVGVLTSWSEGTLHVTRRDGRSVALREEALVAGKVVPATPARRRGVPAAGAYELQRVAARGWPAVETAALGEWTLRASPVQAAAAREGARPAPREGFTSRANSVLPLGDPGAPLDEALRYVEGWYAERGLPARFQVTTGHAGTDEMLAAALDARGWTAERHTLMRTGALAPLADRTPDARVRLDRRVSAAWLRAYGRTGDAGAPAGPGGGAGRGSGPGSDDAVRATATRVLSGGPSVWFATVPGEADGDGPPAAIGRCVVDGRWAGFSAVEVAPAHRRRGLAGAVMAELARTALAEGASAAYLQVETENAAARALYDGLGFADHHAYHYRRAPRN
ncbi:GNAT family N-acetyltransferase [Streptomyces phytohabitans]|uniref:GNAT family N-acetyltransferase n=1 Tax=Streptomyces phytohabitans TaxID=1150371 RepID=UPI00345BB2BE